jgi:hypothetical protein
MAYLLILTLALFNLLIQLNVKEKLKHYQIAKNNKGKFIRFIINETYQRPVINTGQTAVLLCGVARGYHLLLNGLHRQEPHLHYQVHTTQVIIKLSQESNLHH